MGEKVGDIEYRVRLVLAYAYVYFTKVLGNNNSVKREGSGNPLIFANSAVVMSFEINYTAILVNGALFNIKSGRINV